MRSLPAGTAFCLACILSLGTRSAPGEESKNESFENSLGMAFRLIPAGRYQVGPPDLDPKEAPWTTGNPAAGTAAQLLKPFYLCAHEVRVKDYRAFCEATQRPAPEGELYVPDTHQWKKGFKPLDDPVWGKFDLPIACVSFDDAQAFCTWLSKKENRVYRIPTEVEWEYAARAGNSPSYQADSQVNPTQVNGALATDRPVRANPMDELADAEAGLDKADDTGATPTDGTAATGVGATSPAGKPYPPNPWGLAHMLGNVQEFVVMTVPPPEGDRPFVSWTHLPGKQNRMLRGGSWLHAGRDCTPYQANFNCPPYSNCSIGFRVLLEIADK